MKSPATHKTPQKAYKHLVMIPLPTIKRVLDCIETEGLYTPLFKEEVMYM